MDGHYLAMPL